MVGHSRRNKKVVAPVVEAPKPKAKPKAKKSLKNLFKKKKSE